MQASTPRIAILIPAIVAFSASSQAPLSQAPCTATSPTASLAIPHMSGEPKLSIDPGSVIWKKAATTSIVKDCSRTVDYPDLKTEVRGFWTDSHLYLLFTCPYRSLNLFCRPRTAAIETNSGIVMWWKCFWAMTGSTSDIIASMKLLRRETGLIWRSI